MAKVIQDYAIGVNYLHGEVVFSGTKIKKVTFDPSFAKIPSVKTGLVNASSQSNYEDTVTKNHFWIRFTNKYTGIVTWDAKEMD